MRDMVFQHDPGRQTSAPTHHRGLLVSPRPAVREPMTETHDPRRKARTIMASDSEWARIRERADTRAMPISRYVVQQALTTTTPQPENLPADLQWRLAHLLMVLGRIEEYRFERAGESEAWRAIGEEVGALLDAEALMEGREPGR